MAEQLFLGLPLKRNSDNHRKLTFSRQFPHLANSYNEENSDVTFIGQEDQNPIKVHKEVLSVASPVFFKMFKGNFRERNENEFAIPEEYTDEIFSMVISFIYGKEVILEEEGDIVPLYEAAHYYELDVLMNSISQLVSTWSRQDDVDCRLPAVVNLCISAEMREDHSPSQLQLVFNATLRFIIAKLDSFLEEAYKHHFIKLMDKAISKILQSEEVAIKEVDLFLLVHDWVAEDKYKRRIFEFLSSIRYGLISQKHLVYKVAEKELKDLKLFVLALKQHQKFDKETAKGNITQFSSRRQQKGFSPFFPLTKTTLPFISNDSCKAVFGKDQSPGIIISRNSSSTMNLRVEFPVQNGIYYNSMSLQIKVFSFAPLTTSKEEFIFNPSNGCYNYEIQFNADYILSGCRGPGITIWELTEPNTIRKKPVVYSVTLQCPWLVSFKYNLVGSVTITQH